MLSGFCIVLIVTAPGCERRVRDANASPLGKDESTYKLMIVLDLSGSFRDLMIDSGAAWKFTLSCVDKYFRGRIGNESDQIILCQISGGTRSIIWQGSPRSLRERFRTPEHFHNFLKSKAEGDGSMVHTGVAHAVKYLSSQKSVQTGQAEAVTLILSDFLDNGPDSIETEQKLMDEFANYLNLGGHLGLYYVDQERYFRWRENFDRAGFDLVPVEMDVHGRPPLPDFDQ
jgi:hypothetical protein